MGSQAVPDRAVVQHVIEKCKICENPPVYLFFNFLMDEEVDHLLALGEGNWVPSTVGRPVTVSQKKDENFCPQDKQEQDFYRKGRTENRTSYSFMLSNVHDDIAQRVTQRVAKVADMPATHVERLNLVRYEPGQVFKVHHDGTFRPKTVFVYLSDSPAGDGGTTDFPHLGLQIKPKKGMALMWNNILPDGTADERVFHAGTAPKNHIKYGMNCFLNQVDTTPLVSGVNAEGNDVMDSNNEYMELGQFRNLRLDADDGSTSEGEPESAQVAQESAPAPFEAAEASKSADDK